MFNYFQQVKIGENLTKFYKVDKYKTDALKDPSKQGKYLAAKKNLDASIIIAADYNNLGAAETAKRIQEKGLLNDITVSWYAKKDESWFSHRSPGIQSGSHFTITSVETYTDAQGRPIAKVKASFNCILYNYAGVYKVLTNGRFYGEFINFLR